MTADGPAERVQQALEALGVDYEVMPCAEELADTEAFCEHYGVALEDSVNTILVASKSGPEQKFAACALLATARLDVNKVVRKRLGVRRISFASAEQTQALTGMIVGGVAPIGLPESLPLWIDSRVLQRESVVLGGGDRVTKIRVAPTIFELAPGVEIVEGLALPPAP